MPGNMSENASCIELAGMRPILEGNTSMNGPGSQGIWDWQRGGGG